MTQIQPDKMIVFFRPILSASDATAREPTNEPGQVDFKFGFMVAPTII